MHWIPAGSRARFTTAPSQYVAAIAYSRTSTTVAEVQIQTRNLATGVGGNANDIILKGTGTTAGTVDWVCNTSTLTKKYLPANCR